MSLLLYTRQSDETGIEITKALKTSLPDESMEVCSTVNDLALKLSEQEHRRKMAILVPENENKLIDIFSMQSLFNSLPVVLVLPNKERLAVAIAYRMKPRLMCYREGGIAEVVSGLLDMVNSLTIVKPVNILNVYANEKKPPAIIKVASGLYSPPVLPRANEMPRGEVSKSYRW